MDYITFHPNNEDNEHINTCEIDYREYIDSARSIDGEEPVFQYFSPERLSALSGRFAHIRYYNTVREMSDSLMNEWHLIRQDYLNSLNLNVRQADQEEEAQVNTDVWDDIDTIIPE